MANNIPFLDEMQICHFSNEEKEICALGFDFSGEVAPNGSEAIKSISQMWLLAATQQLFEE